MNKQEIIEILSSRELSPNKKFGQNFLCNDEIVTKIVESAGLNREDRVLEIGPGLGCMTSKMVELAGKLTAVEIDAGLYNFLTNKFADKEIQIIHQDFLKSNITEPINKIIANLPYYCASEIIFKCATTFQPELMIIMIQKEMADRILAEAGTPTYGALTATLRYYFNPKILFNVDKKSFYPAPDVTSTVIKLEKRSDSELNAEELTLFHLVVKSAFWGRRKTILKSLSSAPHMNYPKNILHQVFESLEIDPARRGETFTTPEYIKITQQLYKLAVN